MLFSYFLPRFDYPEEETEKLVQLAKGELGVVHCRRDKWVLALAHVIYFLPVVVP